MTTYDTISNLAVWLGENKQLLYDQNNYYNIRQLQQQWRAEREIYCMHEKSTKWQQLNCNLAIRQPGTKTTFISKNDQMTLSCRDGRTIDVWVIRLLLHSTTWLLRRNC